MTHGKLASAGKAVVVGGGGHARSVIDAMEACGTWVVLGLVDPDSSCAFRGHVVLCGDEGLPELFESGVRAAVVGAGHVGDSSLRRRLLRDLTRMGFELPAVIDPTSVLALDARISEGAFVGKLAVINAGASIGAGAIINTSAIVEHDCVVGACAHVAVNATLCGSVKVGEGALIGAGAVVLQGVSVGADVVVGAGAVVTRDVPEGLTVVGAPARPL